MKQHRRFIRSECSPVEDERCQKIGGGNRKFRFLLFSDWIYADPDSSIMNA